MAATGHLNPYWLTAVNAKGHFTHRHNLTKIFQQILMKLRIRKLCSMIIAKCKSHLP